MTYTPEHTARRLTRQQVAEEAARCAAAGMSCSAAALAVGVSRLHMAAVAREAGVSFDPGRWKSRRRTPEVVGGVTISEAAAMLRMKRHQLRDIARRMLAGEPDATGLPMPRQIPTGVRVIYWDREDLAAWISENMPSV